MRAVVGLRTVAGELEFDLDHDGDVDAEDMKALVGRPDLIDAFYSERYWMAAGCDAYRWPLGLAVFDAAIQHGPQQAVVMLQRALGLRADGIVGPNTRRAASLISDDRQERVIRTLCVARARLYVELTKRRGDRFFGGWIGRLFDLQAVCLESLR